MPLHYDDPLVRFDMGYRWPADPASLSHLGGRRMKIVSLNITNLSVEQKLVRGDNAVTKCTGNPQLPTPPPSEITELHNATLYLRTAHNDTAGKKQAWMAAAAIEGKAEKDWDIAYGDLGGIVDKATDTVEGVDAKRGLAQNAGYEVRSDAAPVGPMPQVQNLHLSVGDNAGEIDYGHNPVKGKRVYILQVTQDPAASTGWTQVATPTASKGTITDLVSGQRYWVRVCALGPGNDHGPWSEPAQMLAA